MLPPSSSGAEADGELPPAGRRWGVGTGSILPHLNHSLRAKPAMAGEGPDAGAVERQPSLADLRGQPPR